MAIGQVPRPSRYKVFNNRKVCFSCCDKSQFARAKLGKKNKKSSATGRIKEAQLSFTDSEESVYHIMSVAMLAKSKG